MLNTTHENKMKRNTADQQLETQIQSLVEAQLKKTEHIKGIRPPTPERAELMKKRMDEVAASRGRPLQYAYIGNGLGRGPYVELEDGSIKLDLINGIGIHLMGHSHPRVMAASVRGALADVVMQGNLQPNSEYVDISARLVQIASKNSRLRHAWLATCGTMANENALKICRQKKSPARKIIAMKHAFAGRSTLMAEVTDNPQFKEGLPEYQEVLRVPFFDKNDPQSTEKSLAELKRHVANNENDIAVFTFEPMQGEGGYNVAPREYFLPMLDFCKQKGIPVWADEVQTFCRTGQFFAYETLNIGEYIDVCTIAKTLQDGATLYTQDMNPKPGLIAGTFSGGTAAMHAGLEILDMMENENYFGTHGKIQKIHQEFIGMLNELNTTTCKGQLRDAGGLGLMMAVTPLDGSKDKVNQLLQILFRNGLVAFSCGRSPYRLRFLVPAIMGSTDIQVAKGILEKSILEMLDTKAN